LLGAEAFNLLGLDKREVLSRVLSLTVSQEQSSASLAAVGTAAEAMDEADAEQMADRRDGIR